MVFEGIRRNGIVTWEHVAENCMGNSHVSHTNLVKDQAILSHMWLVNSNM